MRRACPREVGRCCHCSTDAHPSIPAISSIVAERRIAHAKELDDLPPEVEDGVASLHDQLIHPLSRTIETYAMSRASMAGPLLTPQKVLENELLQSIQQFTSFDSSGDGESQNVQRLTESKVVEKLLE